MKTVRLALAGNPNSGKTTLFNALTGAGGRTANYPGVTVAPHEAELECGEYRVIITDLPGAYSIEKSSAEETVTRDMLDALQPDVVIDVIDATALDRSLGLAYELRDRGLRTVTALNMTDILERRGIKIDADKLERTLYTHAVPICARSGEGVTALLDAALSAAADDQRGKGTQHAGERFRAAYFLDSKGKGSTAADRADRLLLGRGGVFIFAAVMLVAAFIAFRIGDLASRAFGSALGTLFESLCALLESHTDMPSAAVSFLRDGVFAGIFGVTAFLPQIALLFFLLGCLEDCGYMARITYITDGFFSRFGLSGRVSIPILLGFGCTVPAVMATRTLKTRREKLRTVLMLPFMSCGARLPVYLLLCGFFFKSAALVTVIVYAVGCFAAMLAAALTSDKRDRSGSALFCELPEYRVPHLRSTLIYTKEKVLDYLRRAGTVIFLSSVILWFLASFGPGGYGASLSSDSFASMIGGTLAPLLRPAGLGTPAIALSLLCGILSKESIISSLYVLYDAGSASALSAAMHADGITAISAGSMLLFILLYTPCVAALATVYHETRSGAFTVFLALSQLIIAFSAAALFFCGANAALALLGPI